MAGTARSADVVTNPILDVLAPIANDRGVGISRNENGTPGWPGLQLFPSFTDSPIATRSSDQLGVGVSSTTSARSATVESAPVYQDWFELIHVLPRSEIAFGNIITQVDQDIEIYNAYRDDSKSLTSITNNVTPGVEFPEISPPVVMGPQTSILGAATTDNSGGTGLGTLDLTIVRALQQGLPTFSGTTVFVFSGANSPLLTLSGTRIVLIPFQFESDLDEILEFLTDVMESISGKEQRVALRGFPRQFFEVTYALDGVDRRRMSALLFDWQSKTFGLPLWHEEVRTTAAVSIGTTSYPVTGADEVDFRVGGLAAIIDDSNTFDVINISAVTATTITASDPSVNAYPAGTSLMPVRVAVVRGAVPSSRALVNLEQFRTEFQVTDNDTGALSGSTTPGFWSTYNSRVLFDDCNVADSGVDQERTLRVYTQDNRTGKIEVSSAWGRGKLSTLKGFTARSRSDLLALRKLFIALQGRLKAFYLPTDHEELVAVATASIGTDTLDIEAVGYPIYAQERSPFNLLRITFTDGTELIRTVTGSVDVDADTERLTLDANWPATRTVDEFERIDFYDLVRFDSDAMRIRHRRVGLATTRMPVMRVFDDDS
jgi:hypothetical protein